MKCAKCVELGQKSAVRASGNMTTLLACTPYYDEDGQYHSHDMNRNTTAYSCSRGVDVYILDELRKHGKSKQQLIEEGYEPVSRLGLVWVRKK